MLDVLSFGEALVDFFPTRPGGPLREVERFARHLGGAPANVAVCMARAGLRVGMQTLVGPDAFGEFVMSALRDEGVDVRAVGRHASAKTGVAFVSIAADGARSFLFFRHPSADMAIGPDAVNEETIRGARLLHLGSSTLAREPSRAATLRAVELASTTNVPISIDPNLRPHLWDDVEEARTLLRPILSRAAVVKISDDELAPLLGITVGADPLESAQRGARALRELGCGVALVTLGAGGAWFDAPSGSGHVPAISTTVVDTTGAGDAFVAGFWAELKESLRAGALPASLPRERITAAVESGCRLGAAAVSAIGATAGVLPRALTALPPPAPQPWPFVEQRTVLKTRIFDVHQRKLVSPRTGEAREFAQLECPDWCNIVALTPDRNVVMVRQVRHGVGEVTLELPGGMVDPEDLNPVSAAVRELREETGYAGIGERLLGTVAPNPAMQSNRCHTAMVTDARIVGSLEQDGGEDLEVVLIPYREIPARVAAGEIQHPLVVTAFAFALGLSPP